MSSFAVISFTHTHHSLSHTVLNDLDMSSYIINDDLCMINDGMLYATQNAVLYDPIDVDVCKHNCFLLRVSL